MSFMIVASYTYQSALRDSLKVTWQVDDLIGEDKPLDFTQPFLPASLVGADDIACLNAHEKLLLNQIRGKSYLHLFVLVEQFIIPMVLKQLQRKGYQDVQAMQALLCFAEEEGKHIQLFQRFAEAFDRGFKTTCGCIAPLDAIAQKILAHHPLSVLLLTLQFEWTTQSHYLESIRDNQEENLDRCFCDLLKHHWLEEAQHTKLDTLLIYELTAILSPEAIEVAVTDYFQLVQILLEGLMAQVQLDLVSLAAAIDRPLSLAEQRETQSAQEQAYRWTFLCAGLTHPNFVKVLGDISPTGKARASELAKALS